MCRCVELKHLWLPRVQDPRPSFLYDDAFCSFTLTKDIDSAMVITLRLCNLRKHKIFPTSPVENAGSHSFTFFYKVISFFLSPMAFYYPFNWPHKDKMRWQNSHNWKCCGKDLKMAWWQRGAQPLNWRPSSETVLAQGFALTSLEPCSLSEFDPVFLARKSNNEQKTSSYETVQLLWPLRTQFVTHCSCNKKKIIIFD